jgi:drug/metabolite transporter (DMT)-like permease
LLNLSIVYVVWGSTYLAIRVAVRPGAGIPPFTLGAVRLTIAGLILIAWGVLRKRRARLSREELIVLAVSGLVMWTLGNGLVAWSEQRVDSSLAALVIASTPLWSAGIEAILDRRIPSITLILALLIGFAGTAILSLPSLSSGAGADMLAMIALLLAPIVWALGSVLQSRRALSISARISSGYQQLFAGLGLVLLVFLANEPAPQPTPEAWIAWVYLLVFGSLIAFTAYVGALQLLPVSVVMTHAYVNPVIAVLLGAWILDEKITLPTVVGAGMVLLGVAGVFRDRRNARTS